MNTNSNDKFFIKQFGLQRSGTNALKALLETNFPKIRLLTTFLGNKHQPIDFDTLNENSNDENFAEYDISSDHVEKIKSQINAKSLPILFK